MFPVGSSDSSPPKRLKAEDEDEDAHDLPVEMQNSRSEGGVQHGQHACINECNMLLPPLLLRQQQFQQPRAMVEGHIEVIRGIYRGEVRMDVQRVRRNGYKRSVEGSIVKRRPSATFKKCYLGRAPRDFRD